MVIYGNAVAIDGGEINLDILIDGGEILLSDMVGGDFGVFYPVSGDTREPYEGAYEVDPEFDPIVLGTREKWMTDDVTVNAITVSRVSNPQGGKTVTIGMY